MVSTQLSDLDADVNKFIEICDLGTVGIDPIPLFLQNNGYHTLNDILDEPFDHFQQHINLLTFNDSQLLMRGTMLTLRIAALYCHYCFSSVTTRTAIIDNWYTAEYTKAEFTWWRKAYCFGGIDKISALKVIADAKYQRQLQKIIWLSMI